MSRCKECGRVCSCSLRRECTGAHGCPMCQRNTTIGEQQNQITALKYELVEIEHLREKASKTIFEQKAKMERLKKSLRQAVAILEEKSTCGNGTT